MLVSVVFIERCPMSVSFVRRTLVGLVRVLVECVI